VLPDHPNVNTFLDIPYAEPPVGDLRFKRPVGFNRKLNKTCTTFGNKCPQINKPNPFYTDVSSGISEDCLHLNIWSPTESNGKLKPVMVWFFGGAFFQGSSLFDETDGRVLASIGDVVVVTLEFRVGALGFLDLGTDDESGNQALYDQVMALKWIQANIEFFGGDPSSVTLFGSASGSMSIGMHMMSPESTGLFNRVIMQSESPLMPFSFFYSDESLVKKFVSILGCSSEQISCLKEKSIEEILSSSQVIHDQHFFVFKPKLDDDFFDLGSPSEIRNLDQNEKDDIFKGIKEVMLGTNTKGFSFMMYQANETIYGLKKVKKRINSLADVRETMTEDLRYLLNMADYKVDFITRPAFKNINSSSEEIWLDRLVRVLTDISFVCPINLLAEQLASLDKPVYLYEFSHRTSNSIWGDWFGPTLHDEVPYVFGYPLRFPYKYSKEEVNFSMRLVKTWSHFAKTGKVLDQLNQEWPPFTTKDKAFMKLDTVSAKIGWNQSQETCDIFRLDFDLTK